MEAAYATELAYAIGAVHEGHRVHDVHDVQQVCLTEFDPLDIGCRVSSNQNARRLSGREIARFRAVLRHFAAELEISDRRLSIASQVGGDNYVNALLRGATKSMDGDVAVRLLSTLGVLAKKRVEEIGRRMAKESGRDLRMVDEARVQAQRELAAFSDFPDWGSRCGLLDVSKILSRYLEFADRWGRKHDRSGVVVLPVLEEVSLIPISTAIEHEALNPRIRRGTVLVLPTRRIGAADEPSAPESIAAAIRDLGVTFVYVIPATLSLKRDRPEHLDELWTDHKTLDANFEQLLRQVHERLKEGGEQAVDLALGYCRKLSIEAIFGRSNRSVEVTRQILDVIGMADHAVVYYDDADRVLGVGLQLACLRGLPDFMNPGDVDPDTQKTRRTTGLVFLAEAERHLFIQSIGSLLEHLLIETRNGRGEVLGLLETQTSSCETGKGAAKDGSNPSIGRKRTTKRTHRLQNNRR